MSFGPSAVVFVDDADRESMQSERHFEVFLVIFPAGRWVSKQDLLAFNPRECRPVLWRRMSQMVVVDKSHLHKATHESM